MTETAPIEGTATPPTTTAGTLLRQAREAAGLHVASLAATLKVPMAKLEALEQDRYDLLPDAVFVRALASSVCRTLKVDPQPVLQLLPRTGQPRLVQDTEHINAPFRTAHDGPAPRWFDQVSRPVLATVVLLLLGALVMVFLPMAQRHVVDRIGRGQERSGQDAARHDPVMPPAGRAAATVPAAMAPVPNVAWPAPADGAANALPAQVPPLRRPRLRPRSRRPRRHRVPVRRLPAARARALRPPPHPPLALRRLRPPAPSRPAASSPFAPAGSRGSRSPMRTASPCTAS